MYKLKNAQGKYIREVDYSELVECTEEEATIFGDGYIDEEYIKEHNYIKEEVK